MGLRSSLILSLGLSGLVAAAPPVRRPRVDASAMNEALAVSAPSESFASSGAYGHFLRSRVFHNAGQHRQAADELLLALATESGSPYLETALAEEYVRLTDYDRAERILKSTLDLRPQYFPAYVLMGRVLLEGHKLDRARTFLHKAIKLKPRETDPYLLLAELGLEAGKLEEATAAVNELADKASEPVGLKRLGAALAERGQSAAARSMLERAVKMDPGDGETWATLAQVDEVLNRPDAAASDYDHALERDPDNRDVLLSAGRIALRLAGPVRARAYFDRVLSLSDDPELPVKVAFAYLAARHLTAAAEVLDDARKQGLHEPRLAFYSGLVHERNGDFSRAADAFAEIPSDSDLLKEARVHRGTCLARGGRTKEAIGLLSAAIAQSPEDVALYPVMAQAFELAGDVPHAEQFLRGSLQRRPAPELYDALADLLGRRGRTDDAIQVLQQGLTRKPEETLLHFSLATAYERRGDYDHSIAQMREVLLRDPDNAAAMNFIGYSLTQKGESWDEAERLLLRALELKPDNGSFLDSLGFLYYRRAEYTRAVSTLERAVGIAPDEPVILEHLGDAYAHVTRSAEASAMYRRAVEALKGASDQESRVQRESLERKLHLLGAR